jgi:hypothetical protein
LVWLCGSRESDRFRLPVLGKEGVEFGSGGVTPLTKAIAKVAILKVAASYQPLNRSTATLGRESVNYFV